MTTGNRCLVTNVGLKKEAKARVDNSSIKIVEFAVGDGDLPLERAKRQALTGLISQKYRAEVNGVFVEPKNPLLVKVNAVVPHKVGGWYIKEVGLYDADGDLYAVGPVDPTYKNEPDSGPKQIGFNFHIVSDNADVINLTIDPDTVYATRDMLVNSMEQHVEAEDPHNQYLQKNLLGKSPGQVPVIGDFGLGRLEFIGSADIDKLLSFGFYRVDKAKGTLPVGIGVGSDNAEFYVEVLPHDLHGDGYVMQRIQHVHTTRTFERRFVNKVWLPWREVAFLDQVKGELSDHESHPNPHSQYLLKKNKDIIGNDNIDGAVRTAIFQGSIYHTDSVTYGIAPHGYGDFEGHVDDLLDAKDIYLHLCTPYNIKRDDEFFLFHVRGYIYGAAKLINVEYGGYCYTRHSRLHREIARGDGSPAIYTDANGNVVLRMLLSSTYHVFLCVDSMKCYGPLLPDGCLTPKLSKSEAVNF